MPDTKRERTVMVPPFYIRTAAVSELEALARGWEHRANMDAADGINEAAVAYRECAADLRAAITRATGAET